MLVSIRNNLFWFWPLFFGYYPSNAFLPDKAKLQLVVAMVVGLPQHEELYGVLVNKKPLRVPFRIVALGRLRNTALEMTSKR